MDWNKIVDIAQDVSHFHAMVSRIRNLDDAQRQKAADQQQPQPTAQT